MSKVIPFQYVDCPKCAGLERQVAEVLAGNARLQRAFIHQRDRYTAAQGKLEEVEEWYAELSDWGPAVLPGLDAILRGTKEEK